MVKNIQNKVSVTVLLCYFDGENGSDNEIYLLFYANICPNYFF